MKLPEPVCRPESDDILQTLSTAIIVAASNLQIVRVNSATEALLELSAAKLLDRSLDEVLSGSVEFLALLQRALRERRSFTERDLEIPLTSSRSIMVDCTISPRLGDDPRRRAEPLGVSVEMTSVERYQKTHLEEHMLLQNRVTTALMRGLAHEIKNPLGGIRGAAQLLERELREPEQTEYTRIIIGEADRLRSLVDTMLGPPGALATRRLNIHDILERVRQIVHAEYGNVVYFALDYDPSLPEILGDRDQLIQAFLNLVRNAARAVRDAGGKITLRTRAQRKFTIGDSLHRLVIRVDIVDTGTGVDTALVEKIFLPMVSGYAEGTGLGLPLAQAMINRHGGFIGFENKPGATTFSVWLPLGGGR